MDCYDLNISTFYIVHELLESWEELNPKIQGLIDEIDDNSRQLTICRKTTIRDTLLYQKFPSIQRELECKIYWCVESKFQELTAHLHLIEKLLKDLIHECQENLLLIKDHDSLINSTLERDNPTVIDWIDEILLHSKFNLIKINKFVSDDYPRSVPIDGVSLKANLTLESGWVNRMKYMTQFIMVKKSNILSDSALNSPKSSPAR